MLASDRLQPASRLIEDVPRKTYKVLRQSLC